MVQHMAKGLSCVGERREDDAVQGTPAIVLWIIYSSKKKVEVAFYFRETEQALLSRHFTKQTGRGCCRGGGCRLSASRKGVNTQPGPQGEWGTLPGTSKGTQLVFIQLLKLLNSRGKELSYEDTRNRADWLSQG